ncbi:MAG TPA: lytic murein transglycosylase, partial [Candidatus Paceibacterota bacterium]|nr:lytic murein transglycosylase [Candidatus Paceibacterota bacterium]
TDAAQRAQLQAQLDQIEKDIANNQGTLSTLQAQRTTLESTIQILDNKIKTAQLQIKQTDLTLKQIGSDITDKQTAIHDVDGKVAQGEAALAQIIREQNEIDNTSLATILLSSGSLSDVFREIDSFQTLKNSLNDSFTRMAALRDDLSARKSALEDKQTEAQQVKTAQLIAKQAVQDDEKQKQNILTATKGQEATYQQLIANKQQQAAAIRAALFGLRDSGAIPFGTAYQYAKEASSGTGVSPALILAILTQESDLGQNTGSCLVTNLSTGEGKGKNTGTYFANVMKAPRDTVPFQTVANAVGRDWATTAVSCPQSTGYGGAMGPAQFIPSTWMLYKDRLTKLTGESFPDPWNARTAIFATALYMSDMGADAGTASAERNAACKYFSGRSCSGSISIYGNSVMELRANIQGQIDILNG